MSGEIEAEDHGEIFTQNFYYETDVGLREKEH